MGKIRVDRRRKTSKEIIAANLKRYRKKLGLSQGDLAVLTGVTQSYISQIESGLCNMTVDLLDIFATHLKVSQFELLYFDSPRNAKKIQEQSEEEETTD